MHHVIQKNSLFRDWLNKERITSHSHAVLYVTNNDAKMKVNLDIVKHKHADEYAQGFLKITVQKTEPNIAKKKSSTT